MKKVILSMLLSCLFITVISCDNENQEGLIHQTVIKKQLVYLGDDLIELEFTEDLKGQDVVSLSLEDAKKVKDFKESFPNSIYFIDKEEIRIFKDDSDLSKYLGKDLPSIEDKKKQKFLKIKNKSSVMNMSNLNYPSVKLYSDKNFVNLAYNNIAYNGYLYVNYNTLNALNLNDATSSLEVFATTYNIDARFYEHDFGGKSLLLRAYVGYPIRLADLSSVQMGTWWWNNWNNEISSFSINPS